MRVRLENLNLLVLVLKLFEVVFVLFFLCSVEKKEAGHRGRELPVWCVEREAGLFMISIQRTIN